jgi:hypothetical protein
MTTILAFSGRKQSGKSTGGEFVQNVIANLGSKISSKIYSFADPLKQNICMDLLGLTHAQCYGSDEDKNSLTKIRWENMPGVLTADQFNEFTRIIRTPLNSDTLRDTREHMRDVGAVWTMLLDSVGPRNGLYKSAIDNYDIIVHEPGFMTARQVMEFVGTRIFRQMKTDIWVEATLKQIYRDGLDLAIIVDARFPDEVDAILNNNGYVIRLTKDDFHSCAEPEVALDKAAYDWNKFSMVIDNQNMTLQEKSKEIMKFILNKGIVSL